jgi:hypothetical protein
MYARALEAFLAWWDRTGTAAVTRGTVRASRVALESGAASIEPSPAGRVQRANPENPHYRPGRATKANMTGYFDRSVKIQLKAIAL